MNNGELYSILENDNKKLTLKELQEIIYQLKIDVFDEALKFKINNKNHYYYLGEENAFHICILLLRKLKEGE